MQSGPNSITPMVDNSTIVSAVAVVRHIRSKITITAGRTQPPPFGLTDCTHVLSRRICRVQRHTGIRVFTIYTAKPIGGFRCLCDG